MGDRHNVSYRLLTVFNERYLLEIIPSDIDQIHLYISKHNLFKKER